jgi:diguanylate cyclase (GGDEF)-like protein
MPLPSILDGFHTEGPAPRVSRFLVAPRRFTYLVMGAVLAAGAPLGLALLRSAAVREFSVAVVAREVKRDLPTFLYVTLSTLAVFSAFGYVLGRQADALVDLSRTDPLTGLRNQRAFEERLVEEVARAQRYHTPLSLIIADVDGLKAINDRGGHHAGDVALRAVGEALRQDARQTDLAARVGGDEFALIAPNTVAPEAFALGERIRCLVAGPGAAGITISVGVATSDFDRPDAAALLQAADAALYEAKRRGRNQVAAASPA